MSFHMVYIIISFKTYIKLTTNYNSHLSDENKDTFLPNVNCFHFKLCIIIFFTKKPNTYKILEVHGLSYIPKVNILL